jgi:hypothetical protein
MKTMIKIRTIDKLAYVVFLLSVMTSCEYFNNEKEPDFRDDLTGTYICLETYTYPTTVPDDPMINWVTDTISENTIVTIDKYQDSSLTVTIGNNYFIATYEEYNKFTCFECNGPYNYAQFFANDSIYVFEKIGVTTYNEYFGKK